MPSSDTERQNALSQARAAATKRVLDENIQTFNDYMVEEAKARGQEWKPRLTDEEKAAKEFEDLLAKYPGLKDRLAEAEAQQS